MIKHVVMWKLKTSGDALHFKALLDTCIDLVPGMRRFEVAMRTPELDANCDVVLHCEFDNTAALAACQNHPHHEPISNSLGALRDTCSVLDYKT